MSWFKKDDELEKAESALASAMGDMLKNSDFGKETASFFEKVKAGGEEGIMAFLHEFVEKGVADPDEAVRFYFACLPSLPTDDQRRAMVATLTLVATLSKTGTRMRDMGLLK